MSISFNPATSQVNTRHVPNNAAGELRRARSDLGQALGSGQLEAAQAAFARLAEASHTDRATQHPDGPFARLQAALTSGDLASAQQAYLQLPGVRKAPDEAQTLGTRPQAGTGGSLGGLLDVSA